jgi:hypothetical protein
MTQSPEIRRRRMKGDCFSSQSSLHSHTKEETLKKPKRRLRESSTRVQKYRIMFGIHFRYVLIQLLFILLLSISPKGDTEFKHFLTFTLMVGGFWVFPIMIIKRMNRIARPNEQRAGVGSWALQASTTIALLYIFAPFSIRWFFTSLGLMLGSIILLLFSAKRASKKRAPPIATTIAE